MSETITNSGSDELVLGVEDEAAPALSSGRFRSCPICRKINPCDQHSFAVQIRTARDPEFLQHEIDGQAGRVSDIEGHGE